MDLFLLEYAKKHNHAMQENDMNFALERTASALSFMALEKQAIGFYIHHFDQRPLSQIAQKQVSLLQEMLSLSPEVIADLAVGIDDSELLMKQIYVPHQAHVLNSYQHCEQILSQEICLKKYSWDAKICKHDDKTDLISCAAYPLEKIIFLQEVLKTAKVEMRKLEPSVYAKERASFTLFNCAYDNIAKESAFELSKYIQCKNPYWLKANLDNLLTLIGLTIKSEAA